MSDETMTATTTIEAGAEMVFAVLADPTTHETIDGTGWVRASDDGEPLRAAGQLFDIAMYHANHPDGHYTMLNRVEEFDPPRAISWQPGQDRDGSGPSFGGWVWRYDLAPRGASATEVTLTYDWSGASAEVREFITFPPFPRSHLENSLAHLGELATQGNDPARGSSAGTR